VLFANLTTGDMTTAYTSSSSLLFNPYTGTLSATEFNSLSDVRFKENFEQITNALDVIDQINPVSFTWKETGEKAYGVIAQEIEEVIPELVRTMKGKKTVSYAQIIPFLVQAIKDLRKDIENLKSK
jgi:hypothetical protein